MIIALRMEALLKHLQENKSVTIRQAKLFVSYGELFQLIAQRKIEVIGHIVTLYPVPTESVNH